MAALESGWRAGLCRSATTPEVARWPAGLRYGDAYQGSRAWPQDSVNETLVGEGRVRRWLGLAELPSGAKPFGWRPGG